MYQINDLFKPHQMGLEKVGRFWYLTKDGDPSALALFHRHYSRRQYKDGRCPVLFVGPGQKMVLITANADALFIWRKFISGDGNVGINCAVFRNESEVLSSVLILDAEIVAGEAWPGERFYTYVACDRIKSSNPGCCFKKAGWKVCGITKVNRLVTLEKVPN